MLSEPPFDSPPACSFRFFCLLPSSLPSSDPPLRTPHMRAALATITHPRSCIRGMTSPPATWLAHHLCPRPSQRQFFLPPFCIIGCRSLCRISSLCISSHANAYCTFGLTNPSLLIHELTTALSVALRRRRLLNASLRCAACRELSSRSC